MIHVEQTSPSQIPLNALLGFPVPSGCKILASTVVSGVLYVKYLPIESLFNDSGSETIPKYFLRTLARDPSNTQIPSFFNPQFWGSNVIGGISTYPGDTTTSYVASIALSAVPLYSQVPNLAPVNIFFFMQSSLGVLSTATSNPNPMSIATGMESFLTVGV